MKTWKIPVVWEGRSIVTVRGNSLDDAIDIAKDDKGVIPIPDDFDFVDDTWELDCYDTECIRQCYNNNQDDD